MSFLLRADKWCVDLTKSDPLFTESLLPVVVLLSTSLEHGLLASPGPGLSALPGGRLAASINPVLHCFRPLT